jgi:hypothetical protein
VIHLWSASDVAVDNRPVTPPVRLSARTRPLPAPVVLAKRRRRAINPWLIAAIAIAAGSFVLNETGVRFGLPYHLHWDEPIIVNRAIRMGSGDLNPHYFDYPSLMMYAVLIAESALYLAGRMLHWYHSSQGFAFYYLTDSTAVFVVGRTLIALIGAATTFLCYSVARRFFSPAAGLLAAAIVAVSPVFVGSAHFVTTDVPMTFFILLAYRFIWDVYKVGGTRPYLLAGAAIGLGIATKYLPGLLFLTLGLAHVFAIRSRTGRWRPRLGDLRLPALALASGGVAFFATSPFSVLDIGTAIHDYSQTAAIATAGACGACQANFVPFLTYDLGWATGWPVYLLSLSGLAALAYGVREQRMRYLILASFPLLLFVAVGVGRNAFARYLVPMVPFMAMAAAAQIVWFTRWARRRFVEVGAPAGWLTPALAIALVAVTVVPPLVASYGFDRYLTQQDSRVMALTWFEANVPTGTPVTVQPMVNRYFLNAPIMTDAQLTTIEDYLPSSMVSLKNKIDEYYGTRPVYRSVPFIYDVEQLRGEGAVYVVISSATYHVAGDATFYAALHSQAHLVAQFGPSMTIPDAKLYPVSSPTISIYRLDQSGE